MKNKQKSFTLIELLVVIAIIGLLAAIVLVGLSSVRLRAQKAKVAVELDQIRKAIRIAQLGEDKVLKDITGNTCSHCPCIESEGGSLNNPECIANMTNVYEKLKIPFLRDPWGSSYVVDENELEFPWELCRHDTIMSAGPSRIILNHPSPYIETDYVRLVPFYSGQCAGPII